MSLHKIKEKLAELNKQTERSAPRENLIWKPNPGKNLIRILPNVHGEPGYPFIDLYFYYKQFGKTMLSPASFGEPDPVIDYCRSLTDGRKLDKDEYKAAKAFEKKLMPTQRTHVPILVRDAEHEGVKFWGFGVKIFQQLLELMDDSDWGDLSDLKTGRDLVVTFTPAPNEQSYPETQVSPKPNVSPATTDPAILEKIKNMPNFGKTFTLPTYDELQVLLKNYLEIPESNNAASTSLSSNITANKSAVDSGFDVTPSPKKNSGVDAAAQSAVDELEALFSTKFE